MEGTGASSLGKANARAPCVRDFERQYVVDLKKKKNRPAPMENMEN